MGKSWERHGNDIAKQGVFCIPYSMDLFSETGEFHIPYRLSFKRKYSINKDAKWGIFFSGYSIF